MCGVVNVGVREGKCFGFSDNNYVLIGCIDFGVVWMFGMGKEEGEIWVNRWRIDDFEIILDNGDF